MKNNGNNNTLEKIRDKIPKYVIYHSRWQLSTVVMAIPITVFSAYFPPYAALALAQVVGACIFWYVDKWIFSD